MQFNENFHKWFGASKVIDKSTNYPQVCYHKSRSKTIFNEFRQHDVIRNPYNKYFGFYFTDKGSEKFVDRHGTGIDIYCYLKIENPYILTQEKPGCFYNQFSKLYRTLCFSEEYCAILINDGFDGIFITGNVNYKQYVAFKPNQIKHVDNNGNFSIETSNIFE